MPARGMASRMKRTNCGMSAGLGGRKWMPRTGNGPGTAARPEAMRRTGRRARRKDAGMRMILNGINSRETRMFIPSLTLRLRCRVVRFSGAAHDAAVLCDEVDSAQRLDILQRIFGHGNDVRRLAGGNGAARFLHPQQRRG